MDAELTREEFDAALIDEAFALGDTAVDARWHEGGVPVFILRGRMQGLTGNAVAERLQPLWGRLRGPIVLDLAECEYMSSSTLGFIVNAALERMDKGWRLYLAAIPRVIRVVFAHMDIDQFFHEFESVDAAVQAARRHSS